MAATTRRKLLTCPGSSHAGGSQGFSSGNSPRASARATLSGLDQGPGLSAVSRGAGTGASDSATIRGAPAKSAEQCRSCGGLEIEMSGDKVIELALNRLASASCVGQGGEVGIGEGNMREWKALHRRGGESGKAAGCGNGPGAGGSP